MGSRLSRFWWDRLDATTRADMISADAIGAAIVAAFDEDNRTIAALRAKLAETEQELSGLRNRLAVRTWWQLCATHGSFNAEHEWGCPDCVRDLRRHLTILDQHHDAIREALGLTGFESRPYAAYVRDLQQQLAQAEQERDNWRQLSENYTEHVKSLDERHLDLQQQIADAHAKIRLLENKS